MNRRTFLNQSIASSVGLLAGTSLLAKDNSQDQKPGRRQKASIAISLDLEMARNFPHWEDSHWDYEKGNLNDDTKRYALEAAKRVKAHGGVIHFFLVARALEQENVDWLKQLLAAGHRIGNHTYDHVYLLASKPEEVQYRFSRAPWLLEGKTVPQAIRENIALAHTAIKSRLGVPPTGFRAPGGFADGLTTRPDVQKMLQEIGYSWVSTKYPAHPNSIPGTEPTPEIFQGIIKSQTAAQPFVYPSGLIEIPMSPISDIGAFRNGRWKLDDFLRAIRMALDWTISNRAVFDFLSHPSVLYPMDPEFRAIDLICEMVAENRDKAELVDLETIAKRNHR